MAVPAAEPLVGGHRHNLDAAAAWGVPAHVTVLYPFVEPTAVDEYVLATLAAAVGSVAAFDCRFPRTRWFGEDVLWLDPEPAEPFGELIAAVWRALLSASDRDSVVGVGPSCAVPTPRAATRPAQYD